MNKNDYIWLTHNTTIDNLCKFEDCVEQNIKFQLTRNSHLPKIKEIFADHQTLLYKDELKNFCLEIQDMTITDFCEIALQHNSNLIHKSKRIYYIPADCNLNRAFFWHKTAQQLSASSPQKKLDILLALGPDGYSAEEGHIKALEKQSDKLNALLDLPIPPAFWEREQRKIRLIAAAISEIPHIKEQLENFAEISLPARSKLLMQTAAITAHYNNIDTPEIFLVTKPEMRQLAGKGWQNTDAINIEKSIYIGRRWLKKQSGIRCLALAWHETNHIAMSYGDYSQFPLMEDIMNPKLEYLGDIENSYIFYPQEKINYALEKQFIEECVARTDIKKLGNTFNHSSEYDVATQYMARSLNKEY